MTTRTTATGVFRNVLFWAATVGVACHAWARDKPVELKINWNKIVGTSKTTPTLQVVVNPMLRRGSPIHDAAFHSLKDLGADYVRYVPWLPYPKLGVAELEPPSDGKTSWDFSLIDPMTTDFMEAQKGHSIVLNFSTIPQWMWKSDKWDYPADPNEVTWAYEKGTELRDPTFKEPAEYFARILSWYTKGGFTDEFGKWHESGHHYSVPYWEVLNEIDYEHSLTPELYTKIYDAAVTEMRKVSPETKFVGLGIASTWLRPSFFEYFLNPANHAPGVPLDYISYHFYAFPEIDQTPEVQQFVFFAQADGFLNAVRYIESIRKRLSPGTGTMVNEMGAASAYDMGQAQPGTPLPPIPESYWNLAGATYAYVFGEFVRMGIDVAGESQLVAYPTQFPSVAMVNWNTGTPNPRLRILQLLHDNFGPGDRVVDREGEESPFVYSLPVITKNDKKRVLLVNKRDRPFQVTIPGARGGQQAYVDQITGYGPVASASLDSDSLTLNGYSVTAVTLP